MAATPADYCKRLVAAQDGQKEADIVAQWQTLPVPQRVVSLGIRLLSNGKVLSASELTPDLIGKIEVSLTCGDSPPVIWHPKSIETIGALMRE